MLMKSMFIVRSIYQRNLATCENLWKTRDCHLKDFVANTKHVNNLRRNYDQL